VLALSLSRLPPPLSLSFSLSLSLSIAQGTRVYVRTCARVCMRAYPVREERRPPPQERCSRRSCVCVRRELVKGLTSDLETIVKVAHWAGVSGPQIFNYPAERNRAGSLFEQPVPAREEERGQRTRAPKESGGYLARGTERRNRNSRSLYSSPPPPAPAPDSARSALRKARPCNAFWASDISATLPVRATRASASCLYNSEARP